MDVQIIGLTGSIGSGCSYVAEEILKPLGYEFASLSKKLKEEYSPPTGTDQSGLRRAYQNFGDKQRKEEGHNYFARLVCEEIKAATEENGSQKWIVDSIRNPDEVHWLREQFPNFFLFGVYATKDRRWERKELDYGGNKRSFDEDDERDTGRTSDKHGQRVEDCFAEADVVFSNDEDFRVPGNESFNSFAGKVKSYVDLVSKPLSRRQPMQIESLMAAAYTVSQQSSCFKRKVGAVIVDSDNCIISSGFNEAPRHSRPCAKLLGGCQRTLEWEKVSTDLAAEVPVLAGDSSAVMACLKRNLKILDRCRALHAEENAIVSLAKNGGSSRLGECVLYATTYPCRQCANKIVNLGLKRVVYLEPYPDQEAKEILRDGNVQDEFFEGITFKAYSRIYGEKK